MFGIDNVSLIILLVVAGGIGYSVYKSRKGVTDYVADE
jgi:hypothetical protein